MMAILTLTTKVTWVNLYTTKNIFNESHMRQTPPMKLIKDYKVRLSMGMKCVCLEDLLDGSYGPDTSRT